MQVQDLSGKQCTVKLIGSSTLGQLKAELEKQLGVLPNKQKIVHQGSIIEATDDATLVACNLKNKDLIVLGRRRPSDAKNWFEDEERIQ